MKMSLAGKLFFTGAGLYALGSWLEKRAEAEDDEDEDDIDEEPLDAETIWWMIEEYERQALRDYAAQNGADIFWAIEQLRTHKRNPDPDRGLFLGIFP